MNPSVPAARVSVTHEAALEAARDRPDLSRTEEGRRALAAAWEVGPAAVVALCRNHPTPDQLSEADREKQRALRLANIREVAHRAFDVKQALGGGWGDATRREVYELVTSMLETVDLLAEWCRGDDRGERASEAVWLKVRTAAESPLVREAMAKTNNIIDQAIAEENARLSARRAKRRKKP
jgi:hypothetical protein